MASLQSLSRQPQIRVPGLEDIGALKRTEVLGYDSSEKVEGSRQAEEKPQKDTDTGWHVGNGNAGLGGCVRKRLLDSPKTQVTFNFFTWSCL